MTSASSLSLACFLVYPGGIRSHFCFFLSAHSRRYNPELTSFSDFPPQGGVRRSTFAGVTSRSGTSKGTAAVPRPGSLSGSSGPSRSFNSLERRHGESLRGESRKQARFKSTIAWLFFFCFGSIKTDWFKAPARSDSAPAVSLGCCCPSLSVQHTQRTTETTLIIFFCRQKKSGPRTCKRCLVNGTERKRDERTPPKKWSDSSIRRSSSREVSSGRSSPSKGWRTGKIKL